MDSGQQANYEFSAGFSEYKFTLPQYGIQLQLNKTKQFERKVRDGKKTIGRKKVTRSIHESGMGAKSRT